MKIKKIRFLAVLGIFLGSLLAFDKNWYYWTSPLVVIFYILLLVDLRNLKIDVLELVLLITLAVILMVSALVSGADYYPTKRSMYFMLLFVLYFLLCAVYNDMPSRSLQVTVGAIFLILFYYLTVLSPAEELLSIRPRDKNVVGNWAFAGLVAAILQFILIKTYKSAIAIVVMALFVFFSGSAKLIFPTTLLLITIFPMLRFNHYLFIISSFVAVTALANTVGLFSLDMFQVGVSKNLEFVSDVVAVGRSSVNTRIELMVESLRFYWAGNVIIGMGLESERAILGSYSHNSFISLLVGGGLIGFSIFIFYLLRILWKVISLQANQMLVFFFAVFFGVIFIFNGLRFYDSIPLMVVLAMIASSSSFERAGPKHR